jgi:ABC-type Fe3+/spermidine/putrescine transport system ATPase subunit
LSATSGATVSQGCKLEIEGLAKSYGGVEAISGVTLTVPPGALITLLGPSGCGKTTLMRSIAGFVSPDRGRIALDGRDLLALPPERRSTAMLFQNYSLFPHMTVATNVGFGLRMHGVRRAEAEPRIAEALRLTRIAELADRYPGQLSGGQQQRVALARALVTRPDILLLDEPFGALDQSLREQVQIELRKLQQSLGITTLVVTHDQLEALTLSDLVAVMNAGRIEQIGPPIEIYDRPATAFVAKFMGVENLLPVRLGARDGDRTRVTSGSLEALVRPRDIAASTNSAILAVRADAVQITSAEEPGSVAGRIAFATNRGSSALYEVTTDDGQNLQASEDRRGSTLRPLGARVGVRLRGEACCLVTG